MVLINRDLLEPAPDQHFVEFRQFGRLASDKILKCCDTLDLFVSYYRINGGLLLQFPEPENFIGDLIVSVYGFAFCRAALDISGFPSSIFSLIDVFSFFDIKNLLQLFKHGYFNAKS